MKEGCQGAIGMPLGIQIVGRRYQEELILSLMGSPRLSSITLQYIQQFCIQKRV